MVVLRRLDDLVLIDNSTTLTVNAPGTENRTTFLPFHSLVDRAIAVLVSTLCLESMMIGACTYEYHKQATV